MRANDVARFFDTSGCLNLTRPTSGTLVRSKSPNKQFSRRTIPARDQVKIDLYNFDHIDFADSKYVLTSPRSLEACFRLNIKVVIVCTNKTLVCMHHLTIHLANGIASETTR
jgi:hypothetical protein